MADSKLQRVARGVGSIYEGDDVIVAFNALWDWARIHQIEQHAEDGDAIASAILGLVRDVMGKESHEL